MNKIQIIKLLDKEYPVLPLHEAINNPFQNLIATLLSQRARDDQIIIVVKQLFKKVKNPGPSLYLSPGRKTNTTIAREKLSQ